MLTHSMGTALLRAAVVAAGLIGFGLATAQAAETAAQPEPAEYAPTISKESWSFAGPFGRFDKAQLQRGYKVYKEVCSNCHSMKFMTFRNLSDEGGPGFTEDQVKVLAAGYKVQDGPNDTGEMFERPGKPADHFPAPFANEQAARNANGGGLPPDMSLLAKSRSDRTRFPDFIFNAFRQYQEYGPDYIYSLITSYGKEPPAGVTCTTGNYNPAFVGTTPCLAMPQPIQDGQVTYDDGTKPTIDNYARDVSAFLMWVAEPKLEERKETGLKVMIFLIVLASLLYFTKRRVWSNVAH